MQNVSKGENLHEMSQFAWNVKSYFLAKIRKIFQNGDWWKFYAASLGLNPYVKFSQSPLPQLQITMHIKSWAGQSIWVTEMPIYHTNISFISP